MSLEFNVAQAEVHPKGWGRELWLANNSLYCGKILELNRTKKCSIHFHKIKHETFYILSGIVQIDLYDKYPGEPKSVILKTGDVLPIPQGLMHRFTGIEDSKILEISTQHFEEDSYRQLKGD